MEVLWPRESRASSTARGALTIQEPQPVKGRRVVLKSRILGHIFTVTITIIRVRLLKWPEEKTRPHPFLLLRLHSVPWLGSNHWAHSLHNTSFVQLSKAAWQIVKYRVIFALTKDHASRISYETNNQSMRLFKIYTRLLEWLLKRNILPRPKSRIAFWCN